MPVTNKVVIANNDGSVGIGTTSPAYKLEVSGGDITYKPSVGGNLRLGNDETYGTSGTGRYITIGFGSMSNGGNRIFAHNTGQDGIYIASATGHGVAFRVNGGASNNVVINSSGNVGIGTTSPAVTLEVIGSVRGGNFGLNTDSSFRGGLYAYRNVLGSGTDYGVTVFAEGGSGNGNIYFCPGGSATRQMTILSGGNVGIGSTAPAYKLDVDGFVKTNTGVIITKAIVGGEATPLHLNYASSDGVGPAVRFGGSQGFWDIQPNSNNQSLFFEWNDTTNLLTLTSAGNVGIGTTSPGTGTGGTGLQIHNASTGAGLKVSVGSFFTELQVGSDGTAYLFTTSSKHIVLQTPANSGNVGIGTTSPLVRLDARSPSGYTAASQPQQSAFFGTADPSGPLGIVIQSISGSGNPLRTEITSTRYGVSGNDLTLNRDSGAGSGGLIIHYQGNVGIGTSSAGYRLDAQASVADYVTRIYNTRNGDAAGLLVRAGVNTGNEILLLQDYSGNSRMIVQATGNVGIGTTSPGAKFQVDYDGGNGSGGESNYGILTKSSNGSTQATIGAIQTAGQYANLNLGDIDSGTTRLWHISKRISSSNELGAGGRNLSFYWYNGSGFQAQFAFSTGGSFYAASDVVAYASSDIRLKDNVVKIDSPLEKLMKLNGYTFTWNDKQTTYEVGKKDLGVIAQEVEKVFPEIVKDRETGTKGVMYEKLVPVLIEAIKELKAEINELKNNK